MKGRPASRGGVFYDPALLLDGSRVAPACPPVFIDDPVVPPTGPPNQGNASQGISASASSVSQGRRLS